jgi:hypothetical protein
MEHLAPERDVDERAIIFELIPREIQLIAAGATRPRGPREDHAVRRVADQRLGREGDREIGREAITDTESRREPVPRKERVAILGEPRGGGAELGAGVDEGLHPEPVAGDKGLFTVAVPNAEGEHAVEAGQRAFAPASVRGEHHLHVASGLEIPAGGELGAQLTVVFDLAVVGEQIAPVAGPEGLRCTRASSGGASKRMSPAIPHI